MTGTNTGQISRNGGGYNRHSPQGQEGQTMYRTNKTNKTTFADCIKQYNTDPADEQALTDIATAVAYAVLKKVINATSNPTLQTVRKELTRDIEDLELLSYANDGATRLTFSADGDIETETIDPSLVSAAAKLAGLPLGDGLDLVHEAIVAILDETAKQAEREPGQPTDLERVYTVRRLRRKVYIKVEDSAGAWETVKTTPIQEIYRAVRRSIKYSRAMQTDPRNGYTYLADLATDTESGAVETVYRRLPKYADLGGRVCDFNGAETVPTTADTATVNGVDEIIAALNLSDRQATIVKYRLSGYGYKAIATATGVSDSAIKGQIAEIRRKWSAAGLKAPATK